MIILSVQRGIFMFNKIFKNYKFIFIFTFIIELAMFYVFNHINIGGRFFIPDMGLAPVFGLMFGPVGGLGFACATFISEMYWGGNIIANFLDSLILFLISVFSYKLWYLLPPKDSFTPKFDSLFNILKLLLVMFLSSLMYLMLFLTSCLVFPSIMSELYSLTSFTNHISYAFNLFDFSLIYSLILISIFNILKIPLTIPKKFVTRLNFPYKYFAIPVILILVFIGMTQEFLKESVWSYIFFILSFTSIVIFNLNTFDVGPIQYSKYYSIIEKIIFIFLIIMMVFSFGIFDNMFNRLMGVSFLNGLNAGYIFMITLGVLICISILLTLIHVYFVEKILTNPINVLIDATNNYISEGKLETPKKVSFRLKNFMQNEDDISVLFNSFNALSKLIRTNLDDLKKSTIENERYETEFNIAHNIQINMLSSDFEVFSSGMPFEINAYMSPAREVGGDFYDYFTIDDDNIAFVIGDVSGKGIPAALFMVKTMHLIKNHSKFHDNLSEVYENVNNLSCGRNSDNLFVTSWIGKLNIRTGELSFVNAGHNPPLLRRDNGDFEYLNTSSDLVLGVMDDMLYTEHKLNLKSGDMVFLYTDGLTEANNDYHGFYGEDRLKDVINKNKDQKLSQIIYEINEDIFRYCGTKEQFDDLTMLIIKFNGD